MKDKRQVCHGLEQQIEPIGKDLTARLCSEINLLSISELPKCKDNIEPQPPNLSFAQP
jgi:hypothetical protein